jgi:catechol 2,3-dioxygenase-like lactoylglutathione lyase family enzyme
MKTHVNLATTDIDRSIAFYTTLLNAEPTKVFSDYALFITEEPGLELALSLRDSVAPTIDAHFGVFVENASDVEVAIARLESKGLLSSIEREDTCCYANQTKVWATDPDGRRWEIYTVHENTEERESDNSVCCSGGATERTCC